MPRIAIDQRDLFLNTNLPRASARIKMAPLAALFVLAVAWGAASAAAASAAQGAAPAAAPLTAEDVNAWLDGYLPYALATGDIAGAEVAIVKDGALVTERGYGFADVKKRTPVDPKVTMFRPGSVSKLIVWTAVMQQVEAGKIDLDADINSNSCRGISFRRRVTSSRPRSYAKSRCTMSASASTGSPPTSTSSFTRSDSWYPASW